MSFGPDFGGGDELVEGAGLEIPTLSLLGVGILVGFIVSDIVVAHAKKNDVDRRHQEDGEDNSCGL